MVAVSCNPYEESKEHGRQQAAKKSPVGSFLVFGSHPVGMSTLVAAAAMRKGVFMTRTGIAAELTAASGGNREPRLGTARPCAFILNTAYQFMDKKPGRGTRSGALLPGLSAFFRKFSA